MGFNALRWLTNHLPACLPACLVGPMYGNQTGELARKSAGKGELHRR